MDQNDLESYKLDTLFHDHKRYTLHEVKRLDHHGKWFVSQERWKTQGVIGSGHFGRVWLQEEVSTNLALTNARVRAVKGLEKWRLAEREIDHRRELDTLIQFSQKKVRCF